MPDRILDLPIEEIEASSATQVRTSIDTPLVADYADAMLAGQVFPPIIVFAENGSQRYLLADGFHRLEAGKQAGYKAITCSVRSGGVRNALAYALGANTEHGQRRNNKDKRRAVELALKDPEWGEWSNADISRLCRVSDKTVATVREELVLAGAIDKRESVKIHQGGQTIQRKANADRGSEIRTSLRRGPKTQDEIDAERFFELLDHARQCPYDGASAAERYNARERWADVEFLHQWVGEMLEGIDISEGLVTNEETIDACDIPF